MGLTSTFSISFFGWLLLLFLVFLFLSDGVKAILNFLCPEQIVHDKILLAHFDITHFFGFFLGLPLEAVGFGLVFFGGGVGNGLEFVDLDG